MTDKIWRTNDECREVCSKLAEISDETGVSFSDLLELWKKGLLRTKCITSSRGLK